MRVIPFVLILFILLFGAVTAVETFNAPPQDAQPTAIRPTVTPRTRPTSPRPEDTPVTAAPAVATATPVVVDVQTSSVPQPTATPGAQTAMRVGNTGGDGVFIRRTPNMNDKIRPWQDGTQMTVLGSPVTVNGISWLKVRAPDGAEGYIPQQYLVP